MNGTAIIPTIANSGIQIKEVRIDATYMTRQKAIVIGSEQMTEQMTAAIQNRYPIQIREIEHRTPKKQRQEHAAHSHAENIK